MNALEPIEVHELGDTMGVVAAGLEAHSRSNVACLNKRDGEALADKHFVEPLREVSGVNTDMFDVLALVPDNLGEDLGLAPDGGFLYDATVPVDDANVHRIKRHIESDEKLYGWNSLIGCGAGEDPNVDSWRIAGSRICVVIARMSCVTRRSGSLLAPGDFDRAGIASLGEQSDDWLAAAIWAGVSETGKKLL